MNTKLILIIVGTILAILLIGGVIAFFLYKKSLRNILLRKLYSQKKDMNFEREAYFNSMINRIDVVTKSNPRYQEVHKNAVAIYSRLMDELSNGKLLIRTIKQSLQSTKFNKNNVKKQLKTCEVQKLKIDAIDREFKSAASEIIQQDEFIRNEFTFYQSQLRKVNGAYSQKMLHLSKINSSIEKLFNKIVHLEKDFEKAVSSSKINDANVIVKKYSTYVLKMIEIISEGPAIQTYIYKTVPATSKVIDERYRKLKKEMASPLNHIGYLNSMKKIIKSFEKSKKHFEELKINKAKAGIVRVLKGFKSIENMLNFEIESRKSFYENFDKVVLEIKRIMKYYVEIKKQFKTLVDQGKDINEDTLVLFNDLKKGIKELDQDAIKFSKLKADTDTPYSVKKNRMEAILNQTNWLIKKINNFVQELFNIDLDELAIKNKFGRAEAAINELLLNLTKHNIKLSENEQQKFDALTQLKASIATKIQTETNQALTKEINNFSNDTIAFYKVISGKYEIAIHVQNMLKELAHLRASDEKLNFSLKLAEKNYLEGDYVASLNGIIDSITKGDA